MSIRPKPSRGLLFALLATLAAPGAVAADSASIASYRAIYGIRLAEPSELMAAAQGLAAVEARKTCDGWRYRQRYEIELTPTDGDPSRSTFVLEAQESFDGNRYAFESETDYGFGEALRMVGRAEAGPEGGEVRFTEPARGSLRLPKDAAFAVGSVARQLEAARAGRDSVKMHWFVGAAPDEPLLVSTLIFPAKPAPDASELLEGPRWRFISGFFARAQDATPLYEGEETVAASGVLVEAVYRYEGYALRLEPQVVERLPEPAC